MLLLVIDSLGVCSSWLAKIPGSMLLDSLDSNLLPVSGFEKFGLTPGRSILPESQFRGGASSRGVISPKEHTPEELTPWRSILPLSQTPWESILPVITSNLNNLEILNENLNIS